MNLLVILVLPVAVGVLVGLLSSGGRLGRILDIRIRSPWMLWGAAALQLVQSLTGAQPLLVAVYLLVLGWLAVNLRFGSRTERVGYGCVLAGLSSNGVAVGLNGRMPYDPAAARQVGFVGTGVTPKSFPADVATRLSMLGDIVPIKPLGAVISVGDIAIFAGVALLAATPSLRRTRRGGDEDVALDP